jgi:RNA polymerase sigma-70 factor (ECF subfamily)
MQRYEKTVYYIAFSFTKRNETAMDITQDVFLKAYNRLNTLQNRDNFKSWLSRITYNECVDWKRRNKKHKYEEIDEENMMDEDNSAFNGEKEIIAKEERAALMKSLFKLNTKYRLAVVLRYYKETSVKEIAGILDTSEAVVKNMLYRSLQHIRKDLKNRGALDEIM